MRKNGISESLYKEQQIILERIKRFDAALVGLQFEGKSSVGRNLKEVRSELEFFQEKLTEHIKLEEEAIFPFLESHIPKLGSVLCVLCSEHEDLKGNFKDLDLFVGMLSKQTSKSDDSKIIHKIREIGTYLIYLLRHHIEVERQSIYKTLSRSLRMDEKRALEKQVLEKI